MTKQKPNYFDRSVLRYALTANTNAKAPKPPTITRIEGKPSLRMGAPPELGKPRTIGVAVAALTVVGTIVGVEVAAGCVASGVVAGVAAVDVAAGCVAGSVAVAAAVVGVAADTGGARQAEPVMLFESNVTAPVCARALPFKLAPVCKVMDVDARIFPINAVPVPRVPDETSLHHTLHASPPVTDELADVVRVAADLKIHTPVPLSVRFPVRRKASAQ